MKEYFLESRTVARYRADRPALPSKAIIYRAEIKPTESIDDAMQRTESDPLYGVPATQEDFRFFEEAFQ